MIEAASNSETSVNVNQATWPNIPERNHLPKTRVRRGPWFRTVFGNLWTGVRLTSLLHLSWRSRISSVILLVSYEFLISSGLQARWYPQHWAAKPLADDIKSLDPVDSRTDTTYLNKVCIYRKCIITLFRKMSSMKVVSRIISIIVGISKLFKISWNHDCNVTSLLKSSFFYCDNPTTWLCKTRKPAFSIITHMNEKI
jgi:hypothetical protein